MMTYLIVYDLHNPREKHGQLAGALQHKGAKKILSSAWALQTNLLAMQLRKWIMQFLDTNDRIVISAVGECATYNPLADIPLIKSYRG